MLDLAEELDSMFGQPTTVWDSIEFVAWCENKQTERNERCKRWCATHKGRQSAKDARKRYVTRHPDRVERSQSRYAKLKWQAIKQDPERLERKRKQQAAWVRKRRHERQQQAERNRVG